MTSGDLEYAMFSREEMARRYGRAREEMGRLGLDALFVTGEENFQYFAGTAASAALHASLTRPSVFVLPLEGEPIVVTQRLFGMVLSTEPGLTAGCVRMLWEDVYVISEDGSEQITRESDVLREIPS